MSAFYLAGVVGHLFFDQEDMLASRVGDQVVEADANPNRIVFRTRGRIPVVVAQVSPSGPFLHFPDSEVLSFSSSVSCASDEGFFVLFFYLRLYISASQSLATTSTTGPPMTVWDRIAQGWPDWPQVEEGQ